MKIPTNSAIDAASSGDRLKLNESFFAAGAGFAALAVTVVTLVVVFAAADDFFAVVFLADVAVFFVAISVPPSLLVELWKKYSTADWDDILKNSMGLYLKQENTRTELQKRIAAELAEKAKRKSLDEGEPVDGVDDSAYIENTKVTTTLAWAWVLIFLAIIGLLVWFAAASI